MSGNNLTKERTGDGLRSKDMRQKGEVVKERFEEAGEEAASQHKQKSSVLFTRVERCIRQNERSRW